MTSYLVAMIVTSSNRVLCHVATCWHAFVNIFLHDFCGLLSFIIVIAIKAETMNRTN